MTSVSSTTRSQIGVKVRRIPLWARIVGIILLLAAAVFAVRMAGMSYVPSDLDTSSTLMSEHGNFQVSYESELNPIPINQIQTWTIRVTEPNGQPVDDAQITVDGGMPQHGHGLPTAPQVTEYLGDGRYRVEGIKFHMTGWWVVKVKIANKGTTDNVTFNLMLS